jgi:hypothetical protein
MDYMMYRSRKELASRPHTDGEQMIAHVRMSRELWAGLSAYAAAHGTTASEVIRVMAARLLGDGPADGSEGDPDGAG